MIEDYEKSGFKSMMDNVEETKKQALQSVPQIPRGQIPSGEEITKDYWMVARKIRNMLRHTYRK